MASVDMNAAADRFASQGINSIFLYTNEAHPGENYPPLRSMEQKTKHAQALRDVYGVTRPILLDALDGDCHLAYGGYPNMTWIFNKRGQLMYKSDWTSAESVVDTLQYFLDIKERRKTERRTPFRVERIEYRENDSAAFMTGLERNGQQALDDWDTAFK